MKVGTRGRRRGVLASIGGAGKRAGNDCCYTAVPLEERSAGVLLVDTTIG